MSDGAPNLTETFARLSAFAGWCWRAAAFEVTGPFTVDVPIPTSRSARVATENFAAQGAHLFVTLTGRDISLFSAHPDEQEIVILPGTRYVPATNLHEVGDSVCRCSSSSRRARRSRRSRATPKSRRPFASLVRSPISRSPALGASVTPERPFDIQAVRAIAALLTYENR
jgi:hypothetical protein